ncbi:MAG TPA: glycosyltransferase family 4 protein [Allosphingosinicella sp.]|nr:glycosyltransferase family 4 protein [Allosphingosinicella sp.]
MSSKPMAHGRERRKVLVLGSYAPSLINFRGRLIAAMADRGHEVFAAAPDIDSDIAAKLCAIGATPVPIVLGRTSLNPLATWRSGRELRALVRRLAPDVMIAYTIKPVVLGAAAARAARVPCFAAMITGMGYPFLGGLHPKRVAVRLVAMLMYRRALAASQLVIFQNEDDRSDFRRLRLLPAGKPNVVVNGSGVDLDHFEPRPVPDGISFLMIARFLRDKGISEFAAAAARLKAEFPEVRIRLAGWLDESPDSISRAELDAIIASGVEDLGMLADVRPAIAASSVYVLPSYREGTPRTVLEAMAIGRAVITTDAPGCRGTVVDGENGFLVPVQDSGALYVAMRRFVEQPELARRMGEASLRLVREKFDVNKVNATVLERTGL